MFFIKKSTTIKICKTQMTVDKQLYQVLQAVQTHLDSNLRSIETSCVAELRAGERAISTAYRLVYGNTLENRRLYRQKCSFGLNRE